MDPLLLIRQQVVEEAPPSGQALDALGYRPVENAKYYQFVRSLDPLGRKGDLKIDLLAQVPRASTEVVKRDARRIRPRRYAELHAPGTLLLREHARTAGYRSGSAAGRAADRPLQPVVIPRTGGEISTLPTHHLVDPDRGER